MPQYFFEIEQRSDAWTGLHLGRITSSCADMVITRGGKPSKQCDKLMYRLLAEYVTGESADSDICTPWMQHGIDQEESSVTAFEFQTGLATQPVGFVIGANEHTGCSPDRLVGNNALLELKNPAPFTQIAYLLTNNVKDDYFVQVQFQLWVTEREKAFLSSFHPKLPPVIIEIPRDEEFIRLMSGAVNSFVLEMLDKREQLERRYGPFVRPEPKKRPEPEPFGVTEEDLAWMFPG